MPKEAEKESNKIKKENAKLKRNAIFGKWLEITMNKVDLKIVTTTGQYLKQPFSAIFKREKRYRNEVINEVITIKK